MKPFIFIVASSCICLWLASCQSTNEERISVLQSDDDEYVKRVSKRSLYSFYVVWPSHFYKRLPSGSENPRVTIDDLKYIKIAEEYTNTLSPHDAETALIELFKRIDNDSTQLLRATSNSTTSLPKLALTACLVNLNVKKATAPTEKDVEQLLLLLENNYPDPALLSIALFRCKNITNNSYELLQKKISNIYHTELEEISNSHKVFSKRTCEESDSRSLNSACAYNKAWSTYQYSSFENYRKSKGN